MCSEITTMISGESKTNRTRGTKSISQYFSKIRKEISITQEAESTPLSVPHSDILGVAEGVAFDVGEHRNLEDLKGPSQPPPFSMTSKLLIKNGEANSYCFTVSCVPEGMFNYIE